jgi:hemerythrin superfamily protein
MNESIEPLSGQDPARIEQHIDLTRQQINRTLGELESRLSLRRRLDELLDRVTPDITRMIRLDHAHVLAAFRRFRAFLPPDRKRALVENVCLALTIHATLEEEIFYPAMRGVPGTAEVLEKSAPEHEEMRALIHTLRSMDPLDASYDLTFKKLIRNVLHHVADEETILLPLAEERLADELGRLGREMTRRRIALLRPHAREVVTTTARTFPVGTAAVAVAAGTLGWLLLRGLARGARGD